MTNKSGRRVRQTGAAQGGVVALPRLGVIGLGVLGRRAIALPNTSLVERIAQGRKWIVVLAVLLFGIVALNVSLLKLNSQIGSMAQASQALAQQNARLRSKVVKLSSPERIMKAAEARGFVVPQPATIRYLTHYPQPDAQQRQALLRAASFAGR